MEEEVEEEKEENGEGGGVMNTVILKETETGRVSKPRAAPQRPRLLSGSQGVSLLGEGLSARHQNLLKLNVLLLIILHIYIYMVMR